MSYCYFIPQSDYLPQTNEFNCFGYSYNSMFLGLYNYDCYSNAHNGLYSIKTPQYPALFSLKNTFDYSKFCKRPFGQTPIFNFGLNYNNKWNIFSQFQSKTTQFENTSNTSTNEDEQNPAKTNCKKGDNPQKLGPDFLQRIKQMANKLNCDYKDLLAVINSESSFVTTAKTGSYVGLFQQGVENGAIGDYNKKHGTHYTTEQIRNMSWREQVDLAEKSLLDIKQWAFKDSAKRLSGPDLYALLFAPSRANKEVLYTQDKDPKAYKSNPIDYDKDGKITKSDLQTRLNKKYVSDSTFTA